MKIVMSELYIPADREISYYVSSTANGRGCNERDKLKIQ
jgi:hypothetical protein